ncbi:transcriptional regulator [candidate division KSB1 bacterium]|nr:transcriptional regulator [candidate division KSB1 bacterium]
MHTNLVLTLNGHDRVGIVDHVTKLVLEYDGNVEASRMARLGGEFAMLMLISVPSEKYETLNAGLKSLEKENFTVATFQTGNTDTLNYTGWLPYQMEVNGADHEGIIHHITHYLAQRGINIETMDTSMMKAPMSGTPLFRMTAVIVVPPQLYVKDWQEDLINVGDEMNVDIEVSAYTG